MYIYKNKKGTSIFSYERMNSSGVSDIYFGVVMLAPLFIYRETLDLFSKDKEVSERTLSKGSRVFSVGFVPSSGNFVFNLSDGGIWMVSLETVDSVFAVSDTLYNVRDCTGTFEDDEDDYSFTILNSQG